MPLRTCLSRKTTVSHKLAHNNFCCKLQDIFSAIFSQNILVIFHNKLKKFYVWLIYLKVFCTICMWLIMKLLLHGIDLFFFLFFNLVLLVALRGKLTIILVNSYLNDGMCFLLYVETSLHLQDWFYVTRKEPGPVTYSFTCAVVQQTIEQPAKIDRNVFLYLSCKWILHRKKDGDWYNHS